MLQRIVLAVVVAIGVTIACIVVGGVLITIDVAIAVTIGRDLEKFGAAIGILAGLWYLFSGASWWPRSKAPE